MARWAWRPVRIGTPFEKSDIEYNSKLAERLLCSAFADDFAIALDLVGFKIVPLAGPLYRWALTEAVPASLCPSWCVNVREQEATITSGMAELGGSGRKAKAL